jgi:hypothetical protein
MEERRKIREETKTARGARADGQSHWDTQAHIHTPTEREREDRTLCA